MMNWMSMMSEAAATNGLVALPLMQKGLLVTLMGLLGVFLVLTLFFVTIKLMQLIKPKDNA